MTFIFFDSLLMHREPQGGSFGWAARMLSAGDCDSPHNQSMWPSSPGAWAALGMPVNASMERLRPGGPLFLKNGNDPGGAAFWAPEAQSH